MSRGVLCSDASVSLGREAAVWLPIAHLFLHTPLCFLSGQKSLEGLT